MSENLLEIKNLKKYFNVGSGTLKAVDDISFSIRKGETFGLVGESGCGKSTAGRTILQLYRPTGGEVSFDGELLNELKGREMMEKRREMQMIFQDPYASLDPRMTVEQIVGEPFDIHGLYPKEKERKEKVINLLETVGLSEEHALRFPHEFSGGQRQRIGIARALALDPKFIVCDEPISALDVSIQAQVVNLLQEIQERTGVTYLFIAHDLSMVRYISDRVAVMYLGQIVELSTSEDLYEKPLHPYTKALLSAIPIPDPKIQKKRQRIHLEGDVPSPIDPKEGCRFCDRCPEKMEICEKITPKLQEIAPHHEVACHLFHKEKPL
ncbi:MAG: ATP-binding cassette domain-containing protein [Tissierellia bacterium]|nr:ATP-binding cassette domain-containing protein [Tissierellia bacterium]